MDLLAQIAQTKLETLFTSDALISTVEVSDGYVIFNLDLSHPFESILGIDVTIEFILDGQMTCRIMDFELDEQVRAIGRMNVLFDKFKEMRDKETGNEPPTTPAASDGR